MYMLNILIDMILFIENSLFIDNDYYILIFWVITFDFKQDAIVYNIKSCKQYMNIDESTQS